MLAQRALDRRAGRTHARVALQQLHAQRVEVVRHARGIEVQMELPPAAQARIGERTRALAGRTGCGLCGIDAIDSAIRAPRAVASSAVFSRATFDAILASLRFDPAAADDTPPVTPAPS